jgi:hypothetical protein
VKVGDEDLKSEPRLLGGEELPHRGLSRLGEVVPMRAGEAGLAEQFGEAGGGDEMALLGDVAQGCGRCTGPRLYCAK